MPESQCSNFGMNGLSTAESCLKVHKDFAGCMININHSSDKIVVRGETPSDGGAAAAGNWRRVSVPL